MRGAVLVILQSRTRTHHHYSLHYTYIHPDEDVLYTVGANTTDFKIVVFVYLC